MRPRRLAAFLLMFLVAYSVVAQQPPKTNSDKLHEQIRNIETINLEGKSAVVQNAQKRVLLALYEDLRTALDLDLQDLKKMRETVGADGGRVGGPDVCPLPGG